MKPSFSASEINFVSITEHGALRCNCLDKVLCKRTIEGGAVQVGNACTLCGWFYPVKKASINKPIDSLNDYRKSFEPLREQWRMRCITFSDKQRKQQEAQERKEWFEQHDQYLKTEVWKKRRAKVLERSKGLCEAQMNERCQKYAHQVHPSSMKLQSPRPLFMYMLPDSLAPYLVDSINRCNEFIKDWVACGC